MEVQLRESSTLSLTPELIARLRSNLIFSNQNSEGAIGAFSVLVRGEDKDSIKELYSILAALVNSEAITPMELQWDDEKSIWVRLGDESWG
jgi:hypothetical protein